MSTATVTDAIWFIDNLARIVVDGETTGGTVAIVELEGRRGDMPPLHVHRREDEIFYVLDGRLLLHLPDSSIELGPGEAAFAPGRPARLPCRIGDGALAGDRGARRVRGVRARVGVPAPDEALPPEGRGHDPARLAEIAARYGIELLGPPGTLP